MNTAQIVKDLRARMKKQGVDAYVIEDSDPHLNEIAWEAYCYRSWVTGFDGSVGTVILTADAINLWTDGRYFTQAEIQTKGKKITIFKMNMPGVPTWKEWLETNMKKNSKVAIFGETMNAKVLDELNQSLKENTVKLEIKQNFVLQCNDSFERKDTQAVYKFDKKYSGETTKQKLNRVRKKMQELNVDAQFISTLDDVAWLYNFRCDEKYFSPVTFSHAVITQKSAQLFVETDRLEAALKKELKAAGVQVIAYDKVYEFIKTKLKGKTVLLEKARINYSLFESISKVAKKVKEGANITSLMKSIKNATEIKNISDCLIDDAAAIVKFYVWLEDQLEKTTMTELEASDQLRLFREEVSDFRDDSFNTIMAYGPNAAMMHYRPRENESATIKPKGLLLIDSGGFYFRGTTDTTRTIQLGNVSKIAKRDYTLVLNSMIALTKAKFLKGTSGMKLDVLARNPLWQEGIQYHCGTGHGVGMFLNVHEGPQSFSFDTPIEPGMLLTNEPGVYKPERYGIRTENIMVVKECEETEFGMFYDFETLTRAPIDTRPILKEVLTEEARLWLNRFHKKVNRDLAPKLNKKEKAWLKSRTKPL